MLCVPSKEKNMKRISIMTASIERPEYLFSKIEMTSWLEDLPCSALGSLLIDLSASSLCFHFKYWGREEILLKSQSKKRASTVSNLQL